VIKTNTVLRAICTLAVVCAFAGTAVAQSTLNFTPRGNAGIAVTNTTPFAADVKFTLYNLDGTVSSSNMTNPFTHRIAPMGQLAMMASEIFNLNKAAAWPGGWIQATSSVNGLQGYYFSGDFGNTFDGAEASTALQLQTIPYIASGLTRILITNPGIQSAEITVSFLREGGDPAAEGRSYTVSPHAQVEFLGTGATARVEVKSGPAVVATAVTESPTQLALIHGQAGDARTSKWIVPHFKNGGALSSSLVLGNPSGGVASVSVSFYNNEGGRVYIVSGIEIRPLGSRRVSWLEIANLPIPPDGDGWLLVESALPVVGLALLDDGSSAAAVPLQSLGSERILISRTAIQGLTSELTLVGPAEGPASVTLTFNRPDGSTAMQRPISLAQRGRISLQLADEIPAAARFDSGFVTIRSNAPIYALEQIRLGYGAGLAPVTPQRLSASFVPGVATVTMAKVALVDSVTPGPGARLKITAEGVGSLTDPTLWVGDKSLLLEATGINGTTFESQLPADLEPGPITAKVRSGGVESTSYLGFYSLPDSPIQPDDPVLKGYAYFQKTEVTDSGLDTNQISKIPIRFARVEVRDSTDTIRVVTGTDETGRFETPVPDSIGLSVHVISRSRIQDLRVLNNTNDNTVYSIVRSLDLADFDSPEDEIELFDTSRDSGAFNILDTIQRGNGFLAAAVPNFIPPALTVYWSEKNNEAVLSKLTNGNIRTTTFSLAANAAYILGDRTTDSDEYDDSVILHEYAHMLAAKFSRDDSNGGTHLLGDLLDPRIAWSEGWANFFSSAARGSSVYRDSKAGTNLLRFDIEENVPVGDRFPGYSSEASVHGLLWDLIDENADTADVAQFPFSSIWGAFTDLTAYRNVYLPYFLDRFLVRYPQFADSLRTMALQRNIDFQPDGRPSVTNPFPRTIAINETKHSQQVDSFTSKRTNLASSAHFYSLTVPTSGLTSIRLVIDGLGAAANPSFNDLDLFLYDSNMVKKAESDIGFNGDGEVITMPLAAGTYFIEVRSFYISGETNAMVYNSGLYRLSVTR
jgi:hypothetical protein